MDKEPLALSICQTLKKEGYIAYYAGGYVRDKLLNIPSDDIDIATDASPEDIQRLFKKTLPIGLSFGIIVVIEKGEAFEVATFRQDLHYADGRRPEEVAFCSPQEDAHRRDFTINGLFYDPIKKVIHDFIEGERDLQKKVVRAIGDPELRFKEDRLRMVRAARFAARFQFEIEEKTKKAIQLHASELFPSVSIERIYQELKKMLKTHFDQALYLLWSLGLLKVIFPSLKKESEETFKDKLKCFAFMPIDAGLILYLMLLLNPKNEDELEKLTQYLKMSNQEFKVGQLFLQAKVLEENKTHLQAWVYFYAQDAHWLCLQTLAATLPVDEQAGFLEQKKQHYVQLTDHIERKKHNRPLVRAEHLLRYGVSPGKKLGLLLNEAEKITIENDFSDPQKTIEELKKSPLWKT